MSNTRQSCKKLPLVSFFTLSVRNFCLITSALNHTMRMMTISSIVNKVIIQKSLKMITLKIEEMLFTSY